MKKAIVMSSLVLLIVVSTIFYANQDPAHADNKTLQDLMNHFNQLEKKYQEEEKNIKLTEARIKEIEEQLAKIGENITSSEEDVVSLNQDILKLTDQIADKKIEVKNLVRFIQQSNGSNLYLDFIFGADTITDFIVRMTVTEKLAEYNASLMDEMLNMIDEKEKKYDRLLTSRNELETKREQLRKEQEELGIYMNLIDEDFKTLLEELEDAKATILNYENMGCSLTDNLNNCSKIPKDKEFIRPLERGIITSSYGIRKDPINPGKYSWHYALDIGGNKIGTPVYATASGKVVYIGHPKTPNIPNSSCGGNYIIIQHHINGVYYASRYYHLHEVYASVGQSVTKDTVIGSVGGGEAYDRCTTGAHLDFALARGIYAQDFYSFREPYSFNPRELVNFPNMGTGFQNRYAVY